MYDAIARIKFVNEIQIALVDYFLKKAIALLSGRGHFLA